MLNVGAVCHEVSACIQPTDPDANFSQGLYVAFSNKSNKVENRNALEGHLQTCLQFVDDGVCTRLLFLTIGPHSQELTSYIQIYMDQSIPQAAVNITLKDGTLANTNYDSEPPRSPDSHISLTPSLNHTTFHSTKPLRSSYTVVGRSASSARCGVTRWYVSVVPGREGESDVAAEG